jgi:glycosidase
MTDNNDDYKANGYLNRTDYLRSLADNMGVDYATVKMLADMLGPNEDFDGLVTELEDYDMLYGD